MSILTRTRSTTGTARIGLRALAVAVLWLAQAGLIAQTASTPTVQFPTVADMVAARIPAVANRLTALVSGRVSTNDGGGGTFFYDAASAASTNLGTIFKPAASNGRWLRQYDGALNVKWFGALGDSVSDDTSAIINALQAGAFLANNPTTAFRGMREVWFPAGAFNVTGPITNYAGVLIKGEAIGSGPGVNQPLKSMLLINQTNFPAIEAQGQCAIENMAIIYPTQVFNGTNRFVFPYTINVTNSNGSAQHFSLKNSAIVGASHAIRSTVESTQIDIDGVYTFVYDNFLLLDKCYDASKISKVMQQPSAVRGYFSSLVLAGESGYLSGNPDTAAPVAKTNLVMFDLGRSDLVTFESCFMYQGDTMFRSTYGTDRGGVGYDLNGIHILDCSTDGAQWFIHNNLQCYDFGIVVTGCHALSTDVKGTGANTYGFLKISDNPGVAQPYMVMQVDNCRVNSSGSDNPLLVLIDGPVAEPIVKFSDTVYVSTNATSVVLVNDATQKVYIDGLRRIQNHITGALSYPHNVAIWSGKARATRDGADAKLLTFNGTFPDTPFTIASVSVTPISINGSSTVDIPVSVPLVEASSGSATWAVRFRKVIDYNWDPGDFLDFYYQAVVDMKLAHP